MAAASPASFLSWFSPFKPASPTKLPPPKLSVIAPPPRSAISAESAAAACPSLAYANALFFKSAYNVQVMVDDNEPEEKLVGRFKREVMRAGIIQEVKRRRFHENKQEEKKRKSREAAKRNRRRYSQSQPRNGDRPDAAGKTRSRGESAKEEEKDNWILPDDEDIPY
ncbi:hypothetical protein M569_17505 [Genlisea aurea]|uniref:30S ribosomal protein S21, chloroplastic n=1 Tax=Genlisea aurea TaxID=192259 RepID=S8BRS0_9LAMI|nr:hypothetical protein M569_17505 [Genlisea aurea]